MCGRYGLYRDPSPFARRLRARVPDGFAFEPHYNVAPQQLVAGVRGGAERVLQAFRWGLATPGFAPRGKRPATINARIETLATSPLYAPLAAGRRCVVIADGYYEWQRRSDGSSAPFWIARRDGAALAFAGLWDDAGGEPSCSIVTRPATSALAALHDRMPAVLDEAGADAWLGTAARDPNDAIAALTVAGDTALTFYRVGNAVGNVRNDRPSLIEPVAEPPAQPSLFES